MRDNNFSTRRLGLLALLAAIQLATLLHRQQGGLAAGGRWEAPVLTVRSA